MILVKVSEPHYRPGLKPGSYVSIDICTPFDVYGGETNEKTPLSPKISYSPVEIRELRQYLIGLQHMAEIAGKTDELKCEVPKALHRWILGIKEVYERVPNAPEMF